MLISDGPMGQLIVENLSQKYPKIHNGGMNFLNTFQYINRFLMIECITKNQQNARYSIE